MNKTVKDMIFEALMKARKPLANFEFRLYFDIPTNDSSANSRLNNIRDDLKKQSKIYILCARTREGKKYQEWWIERKTEPNGQGLLI